MPLWAIKYMDMDERWWIDLILQDHRPEIENVIVGSEIFCDGFKTTNARILARKASVEATDLAEWPTDSAVVLRPFGSSH